MAAFTPLFLLALLAVLAGPTCAMLSAEPAKTTVFAGGMGGFACFRIPAIVQTSNGSLLAFAEARVGSCSDAASHAIAFRRSTDDGATWSAVQSAVGNESYYVGNPDAVLTASGKVALVFVRHDPKCTGGCGIGNGVVYSADDGSSWSAPQDISQDFGPASGSLPGPGVALRTNTGRLLVVAHHGAYQRDYVMYSDDEGASWTTISQTFPKMDEAQMTQLPNGSVLLNMRHQTSPQVGRGIAVSNDNGLTFGPTQFDKALVSPVCQASIVTFGNTTYFSNPASTRGRQDISVKRSTDNAVTWSSNYLVEAAPSAGYSCLVKGTVGDDEHGGILFESVNATIAFARFPVQW